MIGKIFNTMCSLPTAPAPDPPPKKVRDQNLVSSARIGKLGKYLGAILHRGLQF